MLQKMLIISNQAIGISLYFKKGQSETNGVSHVSPWMTHGPMGSTNSIMIVFFVSNKCLKRFNYNYPPFFKRITSYHFFVFNFTSTLCLFIFYTKIYSISYTNDKYNMFCVNQQLV